MRIRTYRDEAYSRHFDLIGGGDAESERSSDRCHTSRMLKPELLLAFNSRGRSTRL
jgi:hypothetical protein